MPFMKGKFPMRRTKAFLQKGELKLKESIDVVSINYNHKQAASRGTLDFVQWYLPQLQYKNPDVQVVTFKNMTPSPFFQFFFNNRKKLVVDTDSKSKEELHEFIKNAMCEAQKAEEKEKASTPEHNPAFFGIEHSRQCICEVPGQVPCSSTVPFPEEVRGKFRYSKESQS